MKVYSPSDIADVLQVKESTLRKYSLLLEKQGYSFQRNNQNQRWYSDNDVIVLRKLVTLKNNGDMSLEDCAKAVFLWSKEGDETLPSTDIHSDMERHNNDITELKNTVSHLMGIIERQEEIIKEQFKQQQEYLDSKLNKRDEVLIQALRESQEIKKLLLEQKTLEGERKPKKGILGFFKRN